jgi:HSP20 family molecular chaperone IbpA
MNKQTAKSQDRSERENLIVPHVEVLENGKGITLRADLPGVSNENLSIRVDKDTLLIEGSAQFALPDDLKALHTEVRSRNYRRAFTLGSELDTENIDASLRNGVLSLHIPKRAEHQPRRIEVRVS